MARPLNTELRSCKNANPVTSCLNQLTHGRKFRAALMDAGVDFVAVDNPHANKLTVHIVAVVAQDERDHQRPDVGRPRSCHGAGQELPIGPSA